MDSECRKRVSPGCTLGRRRVLRRTAGTKSAMAQTWANTNWHARPRIGAGGRHRREQRGTTGRGSAKCLGHVRQRTQTLVQVGSTENTSARKETHKQHQQPRDLQVMYAMEQLEESTVLHGNGAAQRRTRPFAENVLGRAGRGHHPKWCSPRLRMSTSICLSLKACLRSFSSGLRLGARRACEGHTVLARVEHNFVTLL